MDTKQLRDSAIWGIDNFDVAFKEMCVKFEEIIRELEHKKMYGEVQKIFKRMKEIRTIISI